MPSPVRCAGGSLLRPALLLLLLAALVVVREDGEGDARAGPQAQAHCCGFPRVTQLPDTPLPLPQPLHPPNVAAPAVYIDGRATARFYSRAVDSANGWFAPGGAPPQAPFDRPFSLVL